MKNNQKLKVHFYGGVDSVTGSNFVLEGENSKIMIDCGLTQGFNPKEKDPNYEPFNYDPNEIDFLLVTHAHIDHIGRIPKLVKDGFRGEIFSTPPTFEIVPLMFEDAVGILTENAKKQKKPVLYEKKDAEQALRMWNTVEYHQVHDLNSEFSIYLNDAGHILGSAIITIIHKPTNQKIVFTGDLGNSPTPLIRNVEFVEDANYLIMESVYGNRNHEGKPVRQEKLKEILNRIIARKGTLIIPVFSLEKTQVLLHEMNNLIESGQVESVPVYFDSPLGIKLTEVYAKQFKNFNKKVQERILAGDEIFDFPKLNRTFTKQESQAIQRIQGPKIIIASSGMSIGGRILDHEKFFLPDPKNAILFIGYQSAGSLGRQILEGQKKININGVPISVKAEVLVVNGYSSHMDSDHLLEFVEKASPNLKKVFVVMGETKSALYLVQKIRDNLGIEAVHPEKGTSVEL